jgi:hypothetical protein
LQPIGFDVYRALRDAHRNNDFRSLGNQLFRLTDKVFHHLLAVSRNVWQIKTTDTETHDPIFHAVAPDNGAVKCEQLFVIDDETESVA